ncbi:hypothetical protein D187_008568 [Cystobacter fuscus DSM 2262]|uniref:Uncharacterized protein n=1 Tax=Cystobacter fuscus (strain ATCC 25194 / DSM 2262 / NBRC 100088 / M29) TaxID=1242864 RepID=S9PDC2_CYSF2|nr:hypothetical protein [Cystobacter fuscus]EPX62380.1 hypothetical protein D187_008568 [Cystobacter fuscus DSM 2262]
MADAMDPKHLDKRTVERYLRSGQLDETSYKRHIEGLPDVAEKSVPVETLMQDEDLDDDFDDEDDEDEDEGDEDAEANE